MKIWIASFAALTLMTAGTAMGGLVGSTNGFVLDRYIGANDNGYFTPADNNTPAKDVIGSVGSFGITSTSAELTASSIEVQIRNNFVNNPTAAGARLGDLFLGFGNYTVDRTGDGALDAASLADGWYGLNDNIDSALNNNWGYAVRLLGDIDVAGASGGIELWKLDTANYVDAILNSDDFFTTRPNHRNRQEVRVDTDFSGNSKDIKDSSGNSVAISGGWSSNLSSNLLTITLNADIAAAFQIADPVGTNTFAYQWAMTCGNDTVQNSLLLATPDDGTQVPEPATAFAFGFGLLGLAFTARRKRK